MLTFIFDCAGLFTDIFNAALELDFFAFLVSVILIQTGFGLFFLFHRGMRKM